MGLRAMAEWVSRRPSGKLIATQRVIGRSSTKLPAFLMKMPTATGSTCTGPSVSRYSWTQSKIGRSWAGPVEKYSSIGKEGPHSLDDFKFTIELNLVSTFNLNRLQAWHMHTNVPNEDEERGVIINTASIAAFEGQIGQVAYTAAKAGIAGMSLTMARDLGSFGIRVNAVAPSLFDTGITAGIPDDYKGVLTKDAAFPKRMGKPEEYARLAVAIIENPMLNGGTIRLDGGQRFAPR